MERYPGEMQDLEASMDMLKNEQAAGAGKNHFKPAPVTFEAAIREEKFVEDSLAATCEALRVELTAKKKTIEELTARLAERRVPWVSAMAAELLGKFKLDEKGNCHYMTAAEAQQQALDIYDFFERHFANATTPNA